MEDAERERKREKGQERRSMHQIQGNARREKSAEWRDDDGGGRVVKRRVLLQEAAWWRQSRARG